MNSRQESAEKQETLRALSLLGRTLAACTEAQIKPYLLRAAAANPWFNPENVRHALDRIQRLLAPQALASWLANYAPRPGKAQGIGVVSAGNIPLVAFHDVLCVWASGHRVMLRTSTRDEALWELIESCLQTTEVKHLAMRFERVKQLKRPNALLAMGRDSTMRYLGKHFQDIPCLLRGERWSCAWLDGQESKQALEALFEDTFRYFGLGCRSVSQLYVPRNYDWTPLLTLWQPLGESLLSSSHYMEHYIYQKAMLVAGQHTYLDAGFVLLREHEAMHAPVGVLNFSYHENEKPMLRLSAHASRLQVVYLADTTLIPRPWENLHFEHLGQAQQPALDSYADRLDTMSFLCSLS